MKIEFAFEVTNLTFVNVDTRSAIISFTISFFACTKVSRRGGHTLMLAGKTIFPTWHHSRNACRVGILIRSIRTVWCTVANIRKADTSAVSASKGATSAFVSMEASFFITVIFTIFVAITSPTGMNTSSRLTSELFFRANLFC